MELRTGDAEQQEHLKRLEEQLELVRREGARDVEVAERASRTRGSENRVSQSEYGLAKARVMQLRQLADEHRELLRRLQLEDVALEEARERHELEHIQDALLMRTTATGAIVNGNRNSKKTSSSFSSSSPSRSYRSSKNLRSRERDHTVSMMPPSMSFSHILPPRFSQSPYEQQLRTRARPHADNRSHHRHTQGSDSGNDIDSDTDTDSAVVVNDSDASASRSAGLLSDICLSPTPTSPPPSTFLPVSTMPPSSQSRRDLDTGYPVVLDDFYSVDSAADGYHPHLHSHLQGPQSQQPAVDTMRVVEGEGEEEGNDNMVGGSETAAVAAGLEAPSAIIQRMKQRMMTFSLSPTTTPAMLPSPTSPPLNDEVFSGDCDVHGDNDKDKAVNMTLMSSSSSIQLMSSPGKTDHEDEGVEDDEDYDEEEENRRYQLARSALRGIIQHTHTNISNNNPVNNN